MGVFCEAILLIVMMPSVFEITAIWPCQSLQIREYLEGWICEPEEMTCRRRFLSAMDWTLMLSRELLGLGT
jgi:hypothetical protein